jgi:hypothetical protein
MHYPYDDLNQALCSCKHQFELSHLINSIKITLEMEELCTLTLNRMVQTGPQRHLKREERPRKVLEGHCRKTDESEDFFVHQPV